MTLQTHADAYLQILRNAAGLTVYPKPEPTHGNPQGIVPDGTKPPYVAVHFAAERPDGGRLDMRSTRLVVRAYCHCVGGNDTASRAVADLVAVALLDARPVIAGRVSWPIRHEVTQPPRIDDSTGLLVVDLVDVYRLETMPG